MHVNVVLLFVDSADGLLDFFGCRLSVVAVDVVVDVPSVLSVVQNVVVVIVMDVVALVVMGGKRWRRMSKKWCRLRKRSKQMRRGRRSELFLFLLLLLLFFIFGG